MQKIIGQSILVFLSSIAGGLLLAQTPSPPSSEVLLGLKKLATVGTALHVAAHPDDENTLLLAYLAKERNVRSAYLSLTRGDGGQNLIGAEQGYNIGIIRTQELLAARRVDGAEQFFSRAYDFGFSKTKDETLQLWNSDKILADVVWTIRKLQPDVITTRFPPDPRAGHGHHQSSAYLAEKAFALAADPSAFPEQLTHVKPWQAKRIVWNTFSRGFQNQPPAEEKSPYISLEIGGYNPFMGKSYTEVAAESRSQHKSQGFGSSANRDTRIDHFLHKGGEIASKDLFDGVDLTWKRIPGSGQVEALIQRTIAEFDYQAPSKSLPLLLQIRKELLKLDQKQHYVPIKLKEVEQLIVQVLGIWMETNPADFAASPGDPMRLSIQVVNRSSMPVSLHSLRWTGAQRDSLVNRMLPYHEASNFTITTTLPASITISQPYWLEKPLNGGIFEVADPLKIGLPENPSETTTTFTLKFDDQLISYTLPWTHKTTDPVDGEIYRPFEIRPTVTATLTEPVYLWTDRQAKPVTVLLHNHREKVSGKLSLKVPANWTVSPAQLDFTLTDKYSEKTLTFMVSPGSANVEASVEPILTLNGSTQAARAIRTIAYKHIPTQTIFPEATAKAAKINVQTLAKKIGYIAGAGDEVPAALQQIGCMVVMLTEAELNKDLSSFDAIIVGVRGYNTEERLRYNQEKLLAYVKNGGTMVVQYFTPSSGFSRGPKVKEVGPYPFKVGRDRVTEEDAEVRFLIPNHPILNKPNKITSADFERWIQERGLYFAEEWDPNYQAILSSNDTDEAPKDGSLLYARHGKGHFVYTGLSFFRELPAGVVGAYRLFANIISIGK